jgi:predicted NACHT family NTPase
LVILGKPGAGKTTFLRYLALQAAKGELERVPIFITLKDWAIRGGSLLDAIEDEFAVCGVSNAGPLIEDLLAQGRVLLLFDALDEVPEVERSRLNTALRDAGDQYPKCQIFITCRTAATERQLERYDYVEVADFDEEQVQIFIPKWFSEDKVQAEAFWYTLNDNPNRGVLELARTPLLLTLFCIVFADLGELPAKRADLYREALNALLKRWDESKGVKRDSPYFNLSLRRKHALFAHVAYYTFIQAEVTFSQDRAEALIGEYVRTLPGAPDLMDLDVDKMLHDLEAQHGVLVETGHRTYAFAHLTFQEYYTAQYVVDNVGEGTIPHLMNHVTKDRWREVFILTASLLSQADLLFKHFFQALDNLIQSNAMLCRFLRWVEHEANDIDSSHSQTGIKSYYLYRTLSRALTFTRSHIRNLDLEHTLAHGCTLARCLDLDHALTSVLDHTSDFDLDPNHNHILDLDLDLALALARALVRARDNHLEPDPLIREVEELRAPTTDEGLASWRSFLEQLRALMIEYRDMGRDWTFTLEQAQDLDHYLFATHLLVQCLDVSTVTDRKAIEEQLLRPPRN